MRNWLRYRTEELEPVGPVPRNGRRDVALVIVLAAAAILEVAFRLDPLGIAAFLTALLIIAALLRRRTHALAIVIAAQAAAVALASFMTDGDDATIFAAHVLALVVAIYALARWASLAHVGIGVLASVLADVVSALLDDAALVDVIFNPLLSLVVVAIGLVFRYRAVVRRQAEVQIRLTERNTLARELHDTVAHHVSAIAVQSQAAQFIVDTDPIAAKQAMAAVEHAANQAIDEMRQMVVVLRSEADELRTVAVGDLAILDDLASTPAVSVSGDTDLTVLPSAVAAAAYRIAQESITNGRRHSRGVTAIHVVAQLTGSGYTIDVTNDGNPSIRNSGSGYGLVGMRERVAALGGTLDAGPKAGTGWRVTATLPIRPGGTG